MELLAYLRILWRRKWVVLLATLMTLAVAVAGTLLTSPSYTATATLRVLTSTSGVGSWAEYDISYADRLMRTYAEIATSAPVLGELAEGLGLSDYPAISVELVASTELMRVSASGEDPALAADTANALADILIQRSRELYTGSAPAASEILSEQLGQLEQELDAQRSQYEDLLASAAPDDEQLAALNRSISLKEQLYTSLLAQYEEVRTADLLRTNTVSIIEPAVVPAAPSKPNKPLNILLGGVVGLAGGIGLALLLDALDTRLYATEQIAEVTQLPVLGKIPLADSKPHSLLVEEESPVSEAFRQLRTNLLALHTCARSGSDPEQAASAWTLAITSAEPQEGKSTIAANLASMFAQAGYRVILIDGDLRRPTLHRIFKLPNQAGLSNYLKRRSSAESDLRIRVVSGVKVLTSGPMPDNPTEMLASENMAALLQRCARSADIILIDSPAMLAVADATVLAPFIDGVLLVVGRNHVRREAVRAVCQQLAKAHAKVLGVVVNRAEPQGQSRYYRYYHAYTLNGEGK